MSASGQTISCECFTERLVQFQIASRLVIAECGEHIACDVACADAVERRDGLRNVIGLLRVQRCECQPQMRQQRDKVIVIEIGDDGVDSFEEARSKRQELRATLSMP